jgi:hypothetical protein
MSVIGAIIVLLVGLAIAAWVSPLIGLIVAAIGLVGLIAAAIGSMRANV